MNIQTSQDKLEIFKIVLKHWNYKLAVLFLFSAPLLVFMPIIRDLAFMQIPADAKSINNHFCSFIHNQNDIPHLVYSCVD